MDPRDPLVTLGAAARAAGVSVRRLRAAALRGELPAYRLGRVKGLSVRHSDVGCWLELGGVVPAPHARRHPEPTRPGVVSTEEHVRHSLARIRALAAEHGARPGADVAWGSVADLAEDALQVVGAEEPRP